MGSHWSYSLKGCAGVGKKALWTDDSDWGLRREARLKALDVMEGLGPLFQEIFGENSCSRTG